MLRMNVDDDSIYHYPNPSTMNSNAFNSQEIIQRNSIDNSTAAVQGQVLLTDQLGLVTPTTVAGTFYGVAFALYCLYVHSLVPQLRRKEQRRRANFMLVHSTTVMVCGLSSLITNSWITQDAYIKHKDYPGGPHRYTFSTCHTHPMVTVSNISQTLVDVLTSAIQVWRVWAIWGTSAYGKLVTVLPLLSFLTFTALHLRNVVLTAILPMAEAVQLNIKTDRVADFAIQGATTLLCTTLISLYLIYKGRQHRELIGAAASVKLYRSIITMLVESYAMESAWLLIVALYFGLRFPAGLFFCQTKTYIEIIAYLLVLYRVASGKAYESRRPSQLGSKRGQIISSLHWHHSKHGAAGQFDETGGTSSGPYLSTDSIVASIA